VNIVLERDAFLYVSDFFEDAEEYDKLVSTAEDESFHPAGRRSASCAICPATLRNRGYFPPPVLDLLKRQD
jgi:hypothetical protein